MKELLEGAFGKGVTDSPGYTHVFTPGDREPVTGDAVRIIAGRHRDSKGVVEWIGPVPTPSGSHVRIALVKRPRSVVPVFAHEIERDAEA